MFSQLIKSHISGAGFNRLLSISLMAALPLTALVAPTTASAQSFGYSWLDDQPKTKQQKKKGQFRKSPDSGKQDKAKAEPAPQPVGPLVLTVSLKAQKVKVFDAKGLIAEAPISSGRVGNATPMGVFTILEKRKVHHSNLYSGAPMPNMNRITWSGVALHAGVLPGYPASHGCIRLPHSFSSKLFTMTKVGNRVIVARDTLEPRSIADARLFTATPDADAPATTAARPSGSVQVADASGSAVPPAQGEASAVAAASPPATETAATAPAAPAAAPANAYRAKWLAEMARRAAAIPEAEAAKAKATAAVPLAGQMADDAKDDLMAARVEAERAAQLRKKVARDLESADRDLKAFVKRLTTDKKLTEEGAAKLAETEDVLENKITEFTKGLEAAAADETRTAGILKDAQAAVTAAEAGRKQAVNDLAKADAELKAAIEADASAKRREQKRQLPISVFVSLKTKKLYVRQGYEPVLEVPVTIAEPERPIGTHVFTALAAKDNKSDFSWSVVSVPTLPVEKADASTKKQKKKESRENLAAVLPASYAAGDQTAEKALERITFSDEVREVVADSLKPGSSLMISDHGLSNEFGKFTDFTVALR